MEARLGELKKQARQATRYKNLSGNDPRRRRLSCSPSSVPLPLPPREAAQADFAVAEAMVAEAAAEGPGSRRRGRNRRSRAAGPARCGGQARTLLERARIAAEQMKEAETRARAALSEAKTRLDALTRDHGHAAETGDGCAGRAGPAGG